MMYLFEVVQEALGFLPPKEYFLNNSTTENDRILNRVLDQYEENKKHLSAANKSSKTDFCPAFVSDYINPADETPRNGREFIFLKRALIYSTRVGILNRLEGWSRRRANDEFFDVHAGMGHQLLPYGVSDIFQIVLYSDFERNDLIHYFEPQPRNSADAAISRTHEAQAIVYDMLKDSDDPLALTRNQKYWLGLSELFKALEVVGNSEGELDLYLPDWTAPDFTLDWLLTQINNATPTTIPNVTLDQLGKSQNFREILSMPAPGLRDFESLPPESLKDIRNTPLFERFQRDIRDIASEFSESNTPEDLHSAAKRQRVTSDLERRYQQFCTDYEKSPFSWSTPLQNGIIIGGASSAGAALFSGLSDVDVMSSTVLTAIPFATTIAAEPLINAAHWLFGNRKTVETTKLHYRSFMVDSHSAHA